MCKMCKLCAKLRLVQTTREVEKLPSACRAAPAYIVLCLTSGLLFCPATPLLHLVKKGSAKMAPGWFVSETWNCSSPELRLCCKYLQVTCNQGLTSSVLQGSSSWETSFLSNLQIKSRSSNPAQWLPRGQGEQEAVQMQGTGLWHWVECVKSVGRMRLA